MQPQTAQEKKKPWIWTDDEEEEEPVVGKKKEEITEWRMLNLGMPVTPPVCEQESDARNTVTVPSQHRDGLLLRVQTRCCGKEFICLVDCGASRCYLDSSVVLQLGLQPIAENTTLELGDGTRVPAKGCVKNLVFTMGS